MRYLFMLLFALCGSVHADTGLVVMKSAHNVKETADRLESLLKDKDVNLVARVNHAQAAKKVGMDLRPTEVLIFGNPKAGTPLMQCAQTIGIDLPQKALIWEDEKGQAWLAYNDQQYLAKRHGAAKCVEALNKMSEALANFAKGATGKTR
ncbi:MAG TPA: DUF302 domain-containing protein [Burkholderiales bacterium]|nr:DUF302 domain-containing protein [Burkholderiales bacterium]